MSKSKNREVFFLNALRKKKILNCSPDKDDIVHHVDTGAMWTGFKTLHVLYSVVQLTTPKYQLIGMAEESQHQKTSLEEGLHG